jgi:probable rRNA maturation factor
LAQVFDIINFFIFSLLGYLLFSALSACLLKEFVYGGANMALKVYVDIVYSPLPALEAARSIQETAEALNHVVCATRSGQAPSALTVRLDHDDAVQQHNARFRHKDKPTNVLSFPTTNEETWDPDEQVFYMGDVLIASNILTSEARMMGKNPRHHLQHLLIHGTLHLFGFDHETEAEAYIMENLEIKILAQLDIPNPYT